MSLYKNRLNLDFAGWVWAVRRNKVREYYRLSNKNTLEFTEENAGFIVSKFFIINPEILRKAYYNLRHNWASQKKENEFIFKPERDMVNFNTFSWFLFKVFADDIDLVEFDDWIDDNWIDFWKKLDTLFPKIDKKDEKGA
jgi:predicted metalloprotease